MGLISRVSSRTYRGLLKCLTPEKLSSKMRTCPKTCNKMPSMSLPRPLKNTTSKKISPPTSKKNSTRSTTQHGIASLAETLVPMSPMKPNTSSTSTLARSQFYCSNLVNSPTLTKNRTSQQKTGKTRFSSFISVTIPKQHEVSQFCKSSPQFVFPMQLSLSLL